MLQQLISHSPDLKRLQDEGYELEVKGGYLLIHQIPYVTNQREVKRGVLVSELSLANNITTTCLLYTSPSPRDRQKSRMPSSA